jgi:1,4-alpha-glucan branching enzyme
MAVYEVHLGLGAVAARVSPFDELAEALVPYAVEMGFTHLELMPVTEHPLDASWGHQPVGLFADMPLWRSTRFARFVDRCHVPAGRAADWVPAHFRSTPQSGAFDGTRSMSTPTPDRASIPTGIPRSSTSDGARSRTT